jgi:acetamidase/formamidase
MKRLPAVPLEYEFSRHREPRTRITPGETLIVESEDAFSGQIRTTDDRRDKCSQPRSNPLTGPILVEGAEPGDSLAVTIESIKPLLGKCFTRTSDPKQLCEWLGDDCPHGTRVCEIVDGAIRWNERISIPYAPMLGCIGTAPGWGTPTTLPAGPHGGNMDIVEVAPGSTIYLPIEVSGGYLYLGDAHAAMGHGELSASGLEMPAASMITVRLEKGRTIAGPRIATADAIMTVVSGTPMERSTAQAFAQLILWMESDFGWNRWQAYDLLTHVAQTSVGYYGIGTIGVKIAKQYL